MNELTIKGTDDLGRAAEEFLRKKGDRTIIAFYGSMGAGKTTFTTALCNYMGVQDIVTSPTFTIVNEYKDAEDNYIYHFDFYRINRLAEAMDIGLYEYFDSGCLCLIEWPEMIEELLPEDTLRVHITVNDDLSRTLTWE